MNITKFDQGDNYYAPVVMRLEAVDHDANGLKIVSRTIRAQIDDGPWFYGLEHHFEIAASMLKVINEENQ